LFRFIGAQVSGAFFGVIFQPATKNLDLAETVPHRIFKPENARPGFNLKFLNPQVSHTALAAIR
jgi:hypothetical protein